jgi:hypothetical protein
MTYSDTINDFKSKQIETLQDKIEELTIKIEMLEQKLSYYE